MGELKQPSLRHSMHNPLVLISKVLLSLAILLGDAANCSGITKINVIVKTESLLSLPEFYQGK